MKYEKTALRIREAMNDMGMSQQELSEKSHIGKSSISHYVNGTHQPMNKSAYQIAKALNVNPAWIMGLDANKEIMVETEEHSSDIVIEYAKKLSELSPDQFDNVKKYIDFISNN